MPTSPRDLKVTVTNNEVTLTWSRPDPPNGLITQYSVSIITSSYYFENFHYLGILY